MIKVTVVHRWPLNSDHNFKKVGQLVVLLRRYPTQSFAYSVKQMLIALTKHNNSINLRVYIE